MDPFRGTLIKLASPRLSPLFVTLQEYYRACKPLRTRKAEWLIATLLGDLAPEKLKILKKRPYKIPLDGLPSGSAREINFAKWTRTEQ